MQKFRNVVVAGVLGLLAVGVAAGPAGAAPTGAKNAFFLTAICDGRPVNVVVNSANGRGSGTMNNPKGQANFAPAHVVGSTQVFLPTSFNITFSFTTPDGQTFTQVQNISKQNVSKGTTTCSIDITETSPDGTFSLKGTVTGRFV